MNAVMTKPLKLYVFYCSNSVSADDIGRKFPANDGDEYKVIGLPCSGKVDLLYLVKAFETGADGVVLVTCPRNECRYFEGNLRAPKRAGKVNALMEEIGLGRDRMTVIGIDDGGIDRVLSSIADFRERLRSSIR